MPALNSGDRWTMADDYWLLELIRQNTPTGVIAMKMGRSEFAIFVRASILGVSLKPVNQSPYNRRPR